MNRAGLRVELTHANCHRLRNLGREGSLREDRDRGALGAVTEPGWLIGDRYRVVDRIGAGGMADVFRAHDELLNRDVAVKVFRTLPATPDTASGVERQRAELHALARLNHPNLITLFDGSVTDRPAYLIMELIDGPSLSERIGVAPIPEPEAREIAIQVAGALAYVHSEGMVHRDVKPANILIGVDRTDESSTVRARLSDFGIVRLLGTESMTSIDATLGTASYLAPEQTRGSGVGPPADIYALGLTLIETLTGTRSFEGPALEAAMARLTRDPAIPTQLPEPWPSLLQAMTAREPAARPSAGEVARALRGDVTGATAPLSTAVPTTGATSVLAGAVPVYGAASQGPPTLAPPTYPPSPREPQRRGATPWIVAAAVLIAALIVGGIILLLTSSSPSGGGSSPSTSATSPRPSRSSTHHSSASRSSATQRDTATGSASKSSSASKSRTTARTSTSASRTSSTSTVPRTSTSVSTTSASTSAVAVASTSASTSRPANP